MHATATATAAAASIARSRIRFAISVPLVPLVAYTILWSSQATHSITICIHVHFSRITHTHTGTACILKMAAWHVYETAAAAAAIGSCWRCDCVGVYDDDITMCIVSTTIEFYELHFSLELVVLLSNCVRSTVLRFFRRSPNETQEHTREAKKSINKIYYLS